MMKTQKSRIRPGVLMAALLLVGALLGGASLLPAPVIGQTPGPDAPFASPDAPQSLVPQGPASTDISSIGSPSPTCYQTVPGQNPCYISWQYLNVTTTAPAYMTQMTLTIDSRVRAVYQGFFTTALYIPGEMHGDGFRVPCGALGSGTNPLLGTTHTYTIMAADTAGLKAANYGSVSCPGVRMVYLPLSLRS